MARGWLFPSRTARAFAQGALTALLCAVLAVPADLRAEFPGSKPAARTKAGPQLTPGQKTLHALNRLTFGPRPGDVARVGTVGLDVWFEQQLHPEAISDAGLEARLAKFPAMRLTQAQLVERFPTPEMLRRYSRGDLAVPDDDVERAIYADASLSYEEKANAKRAAQATAAGADGTLSPPPAMVPARILSRPDGGSAPASGITARPETVAPIERKSGEARPGVPMGIGASDPGDVPVVPLPLPAKQALLSLPPGERMSRLVEMTPEGMQSLQAALKGPDQERLYAGMTPEQVEQVAAMKSPERLIGSEALSVRLLRDVYSERQIQAVMTDFWLNHFNVFLRKNQSEPYLLPAYEREAVLPNALGKFEDLLVATAESPAMLVYLDNWESVGPNSKAAGRAAAAVQGSRPGTPAAKVAAKAPKGINENYARELMELHTLGVNGGYTQQDVIEVAKCFTGWTIDRPAAGGEFLFNANRHEPGDKIVLGSVIHESGVNEGLEVLHLLATSPSTAHFVSLKLAERFVSDTPSPALVDRMARSFLNTDGDISAVLRTMFHSPEFWSTRVYRAKVKTPLEFVTSALRATDAEVVNPVPLVQAMDRLGMPVYGMQTPNGYSWQADAWVSSNALLARMNFALVLSGNRLQGTRVGWAEVAGAGADVGSLPDAATEQRLETVLLGQPASAQTREAALTGAATPGLQRQAEQRFQATPVAAGRTSMQQGGGGQVPRPKAGPPLLRSVAETPLATTAGLLLGSPDFQRR